MTMAQDGGRLSALCTGRLYPKEILVVLTFVRGLNDKGIIYNLGHKHFSLDLALVPSGLLATVVLLSTEDPKCVCTQVHRILVHVTLYLGCAQFQYLVSGCYV